ncbi:MAG: hypothetical protein ABI462_06415 [Ignavibacteria bacterium]
MKKNSNFKFVSVKIIAFFYLIATTLSCNFNSVDSGYNHDVVIAISGTVDGLPRDVSYISGVTEMNNAEYSVASAVPDQNNSILLELASPPFKYLYNIDGFFTNNSQDVQLSNHYAKVNSLGIYAFDEKDNYAGEIFKDNYKSNPYTEGYFYVTLLYSDRPLRISGTDADDYNKTITYYNINLGEGWNVITARIEAVENDFYELNVFNGEPDGAEWYFEGPNLSDQKFKRLFHH